MMKLLFTTSIFLLFALLLPATTFAYEFEVDGIYYAHRLYGEILSDTEVAVTYGSSYLSSYSGDIVIPDSVTYDGITYSVTAIDQSAFSYCMGLTSIVIPNTVDYIGDYAFSNCTALTSIDIPNSVNYIGQGAFGNTKWYNDQPDGLVYAGLIAYRYKGTMPTGTSLALAEGTRGIAEYAFFGCEGLESIDLPNSVISIGDYAFQWCTGLTCASIGNSVQYIGDYAFNECYNLTSIDIPNSVSVIGEYAFNWCVGLTSLSIGKSVNTIGSDVFYGCRNLSCITVASGNRNYDSRDNCNAIIRTASNKLITGCKSTIIPNSVTSIDKGAYVSGSGMTMLEIPSSVTTIGDYAFYECGELDTVKCLGTVPPRMTGYECFSEDTYYNATLVVPHGSEEAYAISSGWELFHIEGWNSAGPGDVNADGQLNITDVTVLIDYLLSGNSLGVSMLGADVNWDGQVNIADVTALIDELLNSNN